MIEITAEIKERKYLQKLSNDIDERLFDLLITHLLDVDKKIKTTSENKKHLIELLDNAVKYLDRKVNKYNKLAYFRYTLIICNKILRYEKTRQDIKDLKKKIVEEYIHSEEPDAGDVIPVNYQINEVRLTYDASYLIYSITKYMGWGMWDNALYFLIASQLIEPDHPKLDEYYKIIKENIKEKEIEEKSFGTPKNKTLALDANVVISHILKDAAGHKFGYTSSFNLEKLENDNKFIITNSVIKEVKEHLDFVLSSLRMKVREDPNLKFNEIKDIIDKKLENLISKYRVESSEAQDLDEIKEFYKLYLDKLEKILMAKIQSGKISKKLRKLAQREGLLPEEGDMRLLAEVIALGDNTGILTEDKDFTQFIGPIYEKFNIEIYG
jgi:hypothetical protein